MKKCFVAAFALVALSAQAQKSAPKKAVPAKTTSSATTLKSLNDSVSYAVGLSVAKFYSQQGIKQLNATLVARAINDVFNKNKELLTEEQSQMAVMRFLNPKLFENMAKGEKFLAQNKSKAGVKATSSGLQYEVLTQGSGAKPTAADTVEVNYVGKLLDGTEFDNSYKRGSSISFSLGGVIRGWTEGLQLMNVGSKYRFYIPYQLAYGMNDQGPIPGGSVLVFDVELLNVKQASAMK
jgi:FKBP-type peptidyl-prolyl cis-trans isomerase FklB